MNQKRYILEFLNTYKHNPDGLISEANLTPRRNFFIGSHELNIEIDPILFEMMQLILN